MIISKRNLAIAGGRILAMLAMLAMLAFIAHSVPFDPAMVPSA